MAHSPFSSQITFLYTPDLEATAHFYEEILTLPLKLDQGTCRIYQVSQDGHELLRALTGEWAELVQVVKGMLS